MNYFHSFKCLCYWLIGIFAINITHETFAKMPLHPSVKLTAFEEYNPFHPSTQVWDQPIAYRPNGKLISYRFKSRLLKNKRDIWVYVPASYSLEEPPYPLLIVFDGQAYTSQLIPGPTILDNLIAERQILPIIAVFISSMGQTERNRELPCYAPFIDSLIQELLPWLQQHYHISDHPSQTIIAGSSYGGLAAAYAALRYPQRFGNVLSQSGAFWWGPPQFPEPWLVKQFESSSLLPIQFYLDVGDQETEASKGKMSMININRLFRNLLLNKGYRVTYHEFKGGHDYACWRKTFAIGLIALIGHPPDAPREAFRHVGP
jgi:enterochelin esterase-like enzyme